MREFKDYTKAPRAARRQRLIWRLSTGLVLALLVALGVWADAVPALAEITGYGANGGSAPDRVAASRTGWLRGVLVGSQEVSHDPLNVLVVGVDRRPPGSKEPQVIGVRTDTIMLVQIIPKTGRVKLLSIPRDLLVEIEPGVEHRINAAYAYGGIEQTVRAVQSYAGVPIDRYAIVDFEGFEDVINAMGKVEVDVEGEFPPKWRMEEGLQRLNGHRALLYARYRGTPGGDLDRIERQQQLVAALRSKALDWDTIAEFPEVMRVVNENVETNLGFREALSLGRALISQGRNAQMTSVRLEGSPYTMPSGAEVLIPNEAANRAILNEFRN